MFVYHACVVPLEVKRKHWIPNQSIVVTGGCELLPGGWESNPSPLEKHRVLLTTEPSGRQLGDSSEACCVSVETWVWIHRTHMKSGEVTNTWRIPREASLVYTAMSKSPHLRHSGNQAQTPQVALWSTHRQTSVHKHEQAHMDTHTHTQDFQKETVSIFLLVFTQWVISNTHLWTLPSSLCAQSSAL